MSDEAIPQEVSRGSVELAPGLTIEAVLLDNGQTVITEESFADFLEWLQVGNDPREVIDQADVFGLGAK